MARRREQEHRPLSPVFSRTARQPCLDAVWPYSAIALGADAAQAARQLTQTASCGGYMRASLFAR